MAWQDDFNRADGPVDNGWVIPSGGSCVISGGIPIASDAVPTLAGDAQGSGSAYAEVDLAGIPGASLWPGLVVKSDVAGLNYYRCLFDLSETGYIVYVQRVDNGSVTTLSTATDSLAVGATPTLRFDYTDGTLTASINGTTVKTQADSTHGDHTYVGMMGCNSSHPVATFRTNLGETRSMEVTPDPLWVGGGPCLITATGTNTEWTDGSDPSTTFSADHGEVELYRYVSATEWELVYTPDDYLGSVIFSETQYGLTDTVTTTVIPPIAGTNGLCQLTPAGAELVNDAGALYEGSRVLTEDTIVVPAGPAPAVPMLTALWETWANTKYDFANPTVGQNIGLAIYKLWYALNAANGDWTGPWANIRSEPVAETVGVILNQFWDAVGETYVSTPDLLAAINAIGSIDLGPIRDDIGIEGQGTWTSLLELLLAMWGEDTPTLTQIAGMVSDIATVAGYNLADVLDAIAALPTADGAAIMAKLNLIQPSESIDLTTLDAKVNHVDATTDALATSLAALRTGSNYTIQDILDAIGDVSTQISGLDAAGAPVWPGLAGATLGASVPLSDGLVVSGPLHGLLFQVTTQPGNAIGYPFGAVMSWSHVGQCIFTSDRGDHERAQSFALDAHLICPKEMRVAASATIRLNHNWGGTVRPFTIT